MPAGAAGWSAGDESDAGDCGAVAAAAAAAARPAQRVSRSVDGVDISTEQACVVVGALYLRRSRSRRCGTAMFSMQQQQQQPPGVFRQRQQDVAVICEPL